MATRSKGAARGDGEPASDKRYYRIGEVSKITGVKPYVLRYWESEFRWMVPQKSKATGSPSSAGWCRRSRSPSSGSTAGAKST